MTPWRNRLVFAAIALVTPPFGGLLLLNFMALGILLRANPAGVPHLDIYNFEKFAQSFPIFYVVGLLPTLCATVYMVRSVKRQRPLRYIGGWYAGCVALSFLVPLPLYLAFITSAPFNSSIFIVIAAHFLASSCSFFFIVAAMNRLFFHRRTSLVYS